MSRAAGRAPLLLLLPSFLSFTACRLVVAERVARCSCCTVCVLRCSLPLPLLYFSFRKGKSEERGGGEQMRRRGGGGGEEEGGEGLRAARRAQLTL